MEKIKFNIRDNITRVYLIAFILLLTSNVFSQTPESKNYTDIKNTKLRNFVNKFQAITNLPFMLDVFTEENKIVEEENEKYIIIGAREDGWEFDYYKYVNSFFAQDYFAIISTHYVSHRNSYEQEDFQLHTFDYNGNLIDCEIIAYFKFEQADKDYYVFPEKIEFDKEHIFIKNRNEINTYEDGGKDLRRIDIKYTKETTYDSLTCTITPDGYIIHTDIEYAKRYFNFKEDPLECKFKLLNKGDGEDIVAVFKYKKTVLEQIKKESEIFSKNVYIIDNSIIAPWMPEPIIKVHSLEQGENYPITRNFIEYKGTCFAKNRLRGYFLIIEDWIYFYGYLDY